MDRLKNLDNNLTIKVGKTSITIKDQENKTRGVIRNINTWKTLQLNKKVDWNIKFNKLGFNVQKLADKLIFKDDKIYYLFNKRQYNIHKEAINKYKNKENFDITSDIEIIKKIDHKLELCNKYNIEVLKVNM